MYGESGCGVPFAGLVNIASSGLQLDVVYGSLASVSSGYQSTLSAPAASHSSESPAANSAPAGLQGTFVSWKLTPVSPTMTFALGAPWRSAWP